MSVTSLFFSFYLKKKYSPLSLDFSVLSCAKSVSFYYVLQQLETEIVDLDNNIACSFLFLSLSYYFCYLEQLSAFNYVPMINVIPQSFVAASDIVADSYLFNDDNFVYWSNYI